MPRQRITDLENELEEKDQLIAALQAEKAELVNRLNQIANIANQEITNDENRWERPHK